MGSSFWDSICCPPTLSTRPGLGCKQRAWTLAPAHKAQGLKDRARGLRTNRSWEPGSETQHSQTLPQEASQGAGTALLAVGTHPCHRHLCHPGSLLTSLKVKGWAYMSNRQVLSAPAPLPGTAGDGGRPSSSPSSDKGTFFPDASPASSVQTPAPLDSLKRCHK